MTDEPIPPEDVTADRDELLAWVEAQRELHGPEVGQAAAQAAMSEARKHHDLYEAELKALRSRYIEEVYQDAGSLEKAGRRLNMSYERVSQLRPRS